MVRKLSTSEVISQKTSPGEGVENKPPTSAFKVISSSNVLHFMAQPCEGSRMQKHCSVDLLECIFIALLALLMELKHLKRRHCSIV